MSSFVEPKKRIPEKLKSALAFSYGFDYGDLQDNRSGFISHWQKKRLRWYILSYSFSIFMWIALSTALPLLCITTFLDGSSLSLLAYLWMGIVLAFFGTFWMWKLWAVTLDVRRGQVAELIGEVRHLREERTARQTVGMEVQEHTEFDHFVVIGRERFIATREQMRAFKHGETYRVYVSPMSRQILSAELLHEADLRALEEDFAFAKPKGSWGADDILATAKKDQQEDS